MIRRLIQINEDACTGCGASAAACHEGAIRMIGGKAKLIREDHCDGLGDCLPACPAGAITFEDRGTPAYNEAAVRAAKEEKAVLGPVHSCPGPRTHIMEHQACAGKRALFLRRRFADRRRLHRLCLW